MLTPSMVRLVMAFGTRWKCDELEIVTPLMSRLLTFEMFMRLLLDVEVAWPSMVPLPVISISCPLPTLMRVLDGLAFWIVAPLASWRLMLLGIENWLQR